MKNYLCSGNQHSKFVGDGRKSGSFIHRAGSLFLGRMLHRTALYHYACVIQLRGKLQIVSLDINRWQKMADYVALHVKYFETYSLRQMNDTYRSLHQNGPL
jgi:hypothetical protein